ncbi:hypothetical protein AwWohl_10890 [Gammaproteobacteria bacterium]|nr:hypothetical protein AwWohl_10890 [Gammaproteobacteria bacterium]
MIDGISTFESKFDYTGLGLRLRAYRMGAALQAEDVAQKLGLSRAVIYRMEKGEIFKIETLERLAQLFNVSIASLLGVEVEYYANVISFFERMRQLEVDSKRIMAHFSPISLLLSSDQYIDYLNNMLQESLPRSLNPESSKSNDYMLEINQALEIIKQRKEFFKQHSPHIISLVGLRDLTQLIQTGLVGRLDLSLATQSERIQAARHEVENIAKLMEQEMMHIQIGLVDDVMPSSNFQIFVGATTSILAVSSFEFGVLPNIRNGIATITASPEAVRHYEAMMSRLWNNAEKGKVGAKRLRKLLA